MIRGSSSKRTMSKTISSACICHRRCCRAWLICCATKSRCPSISLRAAHSSAPRPNRLAKASSSGRIVAVWRWTHKGEWLPLCVLFAGWPRRQQDDRYGKAFGRVVCRPVSRPRRVVAGLNGGEICHNTGSISHFRCVVCGVGLYWSAACVRLQGRLRPMRRLCTPRRVSGWRRIRS